jgi:hypothetical protein
MLHDLRRDYIRPNVPSFLDEVASFSKYAAIWILASFAVSALVWALQAYGALVPSDNPLG